MDQLFLNPSEFLAVETNNCLAEMDLSLHAVCLSLRKHPFVFAGEENSRVQAHIDGDEFSAHILTDETEYSVEVTMGFKIIYSWRCRK